MPNAIQIKRRSSNGSVGAPSASTLKWGELAFNEADNILYYGYGSGNNQAVSVSTIGGSGSFSLRGGTNASGVWPISVTGNSATVTDGVYTTGNQTVGGTKTFSVSGLFDNDFRAAKHSEGGYQVIFSPTQILIGQTDIDVQLAGKVYYDTSAIYNASKEIVNIEYLDSSLSGISITAGSGLVGGGNLSTSRTFDIGQGDGITVNADSIAVNNTVVRTSGDQSISGVKNFLNTTKFKQITFDVTNPPDASGHINCDGGGFIVTNCDNILLNSLLDVKIKYSSTDEGSFQIEDSNTNINQFYVSSGLVAITDSEFLIDSSLDGDVFRIDKSGDIILGKWKSDTIAVDRGGTGRTSYNNGQLLIGSGTSLVANTLTAGSGINITNGSGTITINIPNNAVTNDLFRQSAGFSVVGKSTTGSGNVADILAGSNGVLRRSGTGNLEFGTLVTDNIGNSQVTYAKIQNVTNNRILGRTAGTNGAIEELTASGVRTFINVADGANNYVHPTDGGSGNTITAANLRVLSAITVNTLGHVTSVSSKDLAAADIPNISTDKLTSGTLGVGRGGTGATTLTANNILVGNGTSAISAPYTVETTLSGGSGAIPRADAVKTYVDNLLGANDAMVFKGTIGASIQNPTINSLAIGQAGAVAPSGFSAGWTYRVITTGTYTGSLPQEVGDLIIAVKDFDDLQSYTGNSNSYWTVVQTNIDGAVVGPASSTNNNFVVFNGTTGKLIADSSLSSSGAALTKTDDTNVTLTLEGNAATSLLRAASITAGWSGQLAVGRGGTGASTLTGVTIGNGTNAMTAVAGAANQLLRRNSGNTAYEFFTHNFISNTGNETISGVKTFANRPILNSGITSTGSSEFYLNNSFDNVFRINYGIAGTPVGSIKIVPSGTNYGETSIVSNINGNNTLILPNTDGTLALLTDITASNISGVLSTSKGGTGQTTYTNGQLLIGNTTGHTLTKATLTQGSGLVISNGNGSITISHEDTSTLSGAQGGNGISSITLDGFGHVTNVGTATYVIENELCNKIANCPIDGGTF